MPKQDHLVELIASLSPNERRYFKLFSNIQPGNKKYVQLFDALETKQVYDAKAIGHELGISLKQLGDEKHYLSQMVLKSIRNFDAEANATTNILNAMIEARALLSRGLADYALEHTNKILKKATSLELYNIIPSIITIKQICLRQLSQFDELKKLDKENDIVIQRYTELFEMMQLSFAITSKEQQRKLTSETKELFDTPLLRKGHGAPKSLRAFIIWFNIKAREKIILDGDAKEWLKLVKESIKRCEQNKRIYDISPLGALYIYTDLATAEVDTGNPKEALKVIERLMLKLEQPFKSLSKTEIESIKIFTLYLKVYTLRNLERFDEALETAAHVYAEKHLRPVYDQYSFTLEYALILFHTNRTDLAIDRLNELLQMNTDVRADYQQLVRILMILAQLDLENYQLIPYLIKSTKAWMKRQKNATGDMETFFGVANAIANAPGAQRRKEWLKLQEAVSQGKTETIDKEINLKAWLAKRLKRERT